MNKNITKHGFKKKDYKPKLHRPSNAKGTVFANLTWYRRRKDLVPLVDPKVNLFENSLLKILTQLT